MTLTTLTSAIVRCHAMITVLREGGLHEESRDYLVISKASCESVLYEILFYAKRILLLIAIGYIYHCVMVRFAIDHAEFSMLSASSIYAGRLLLAVHPVRLAFQHLLMYHHSLQFLSSK